MERAPGRNVIAANSSLLESGEYSDFIIRCGGKDFKVHKVIVCPQSSFFKAALAGGFKESQENIIELSDDLESVVRMIDFIYKSTFTLEQGDSDHSNKEKLTAYASTYIIADKHGVDFLKDEAMHRIERLFERKAFSETTADLITIIEHIKYITPHLPENDPMIAKTISILAERTSHILRPSNPEIEEEDIGNSASFFDSSIVMEVIEHRPKFSVSFIKDIRSQDFRRRTEQAQRYKKIISSLEYVIGEIGGGYVQDGYCPHCTKYGKMIHEEDSPETPTNLYPKFDIVCGQCSKKLLVDAKFEE